VAFVFSPQGDLYLHLPAAAATQSFPLLLTRGNVGICDIPDRLSHPIPRMLATELDCGQQKLEGVFSSIIISSIITSIHHTAESRTGRQHVVVKTPRGSGHERLSAYRADRLRQSTCNSRHSQ
jgi:hypothetical protein